MNTDSSPLPPCHQTDEKGWVRDMTSVEHRNRIENLLAEPRLSPYSKIVWIAIALYDLSEDDISTEQATRLMRLTGLCRRVVNAALADVSIWSFLDAVRAKEELEARYPSVKNLK
jgi:hypothetical protein